MVNNEIMLREPGWVKNQTSLSHLIDADRAVAGSGQFRKPSENIAS